MQYDLEALMLTQRGILRLRCRRLWESSTVRFQTTAPKWHTDLPRKLLDGVVLQVLAAHVLEWGWWRRARRQHASLRTCASSGPVTNSTLSQHTVLRSSQARRTRHHSLYQNVGHIYDFGWPIKLVLSAGKQLSEIICTLPVAFLSHTEKVAKSRGNCGPATEQVGATNHSWRQHGNRRNKRVTARAICLTFTRLGHTPNRAAVNCTGDFTRGYEAQ